MQTVAVKPEILVWARETAGLTRQDAVAGLQIKKAHGRSGLDRLRAFESGDQEPTVSMLERMAKLYYRPVITFYLDAPPAPSEAGVDYRSNAAFGTPREEARLKALVRDILGRQLLVREALESEEEAEPVWFVGELPERSGAGTTHGHVVDALMSGAAYAARLFNAARSLLDEILGPDFDVGAYYQENSPSDAFKLLRTRVEGAGVFVLLQGDLGSYHSAIDVQRFRGLAIADPIAPFIVVNDRDSRTAWSFTLLHELTHLCVGSTGVSGPNYTAISEYNTTDKGEHYKARVLEQFCNQVSSNWLLSDASLNSIGVTEYEGIDTLKKKISSFAKRRNLSHTMVAYRLASSRRISHNTYLDLSNFYRDHWKKYKKERNQSSPGGPSYYTIRRHRIGDKLLDFSHRMLYTRALSTSKVATMLKVKPRSVGRLLRPDLME